MVSMRLQNFITIIDFNYDYMNHSISSADSSRSDFHGSHEEEGRNYPNPHNPGTSVELCVCIMRLRKPRGHIVISPDVSVSRRLFIE